MMAAYCEFADDDTEIVRQVIQKCVSSKLRRSFMKEPSLNIKKILALDVIHDTPNRGRRRQDDGWKK